MDPVVDPNYEYDAPMFVDFVNGVDNIDPEADKWFDERQGDEDVFSVAENTRSDNDRESKVKMAEASTLPNEAPNEEPHRLSPQRTDNSKELQSNKDAKPQTPNKRTPKNVVTSLSAWRKKYPVGDESKNTENTATQNQARKTNEQKEPPRKSARLRNISTCSVASNASVGCSMKKAPKIKQHLTLTLPSTPSFMRRAAQVKNVTNQALKTKEQTELEIISKMRKETVNRIKKNKVSMKKALAGQSYVPYRSTGENLTRTHEFHFKTDERLGPSSQHTTTEHKERDFSSSLRQHPPSPTFKNKKPTVPVPFKMTECRKRKEPDSDDNPFGEYQSMAQKVYEFQKKTPERFRVKSVQEQNQGPAPCDQKSSQQRLTNPKTPNLRSKDRTRPRSKDCLSKEEQEKLKEEEMKNFKFKATELNPRIFELQGTLGIQVVPPKPVTAIEPFNLNTVQRAKVQKSIEEVDEDSQHLVQIKAQPVPDFTAVFKPELNHKMTQPEPFSFEERNKEMKLKKEEKIKTILEEEKKSHEFQAQPLRSFTPPPLPASSKLLTEPAPFNLSTEKRGAAKAEKWSQKLQEEIAEERLKRVFKARSTNILYKDPFLPDKAMSKPSTKIEEFTMNTDKRAKEREVYETEKTERQLEEEEARCQLEKEREEEERIYIRNLRKHLVHKPNPIRKYHPLEIKQSDKELTEPQSPEWQTKKRKRLRV